MQTAPQDKLLEFNVREGWEPLCRFLEVDVPFMEFPHKNKGAGVVKEVMDKHPVFVRVKQEALVSLSAVGIILGYVGYSVMTSQSICKSVLGLPYRIFHETVLSLGYTKL